MAAFRGCAADGRGAILDSSIATELAMIEMDLRHGRVT